MAATPKTTGTISLATLGLTAGIFLPAAPAGAVDIVLDYSFDTNNFFGSGNPQGSAAGAEARATLEFAADFFSDLLEDTFSPIQQPEPFVNGPATWTWDYDIRFTHPGNGSTVTIGDNEAAPSFAADEYRIYVGGRSLSGSTLGRGGPGGFSYTNGGSFFPSDRPTIDAISADFEDQFENRGEDSGFANWGGALTFDNDTSANWNFSQTQDPGFGEDDFLSVALHEIGHTLGLGTSDEWSGLISGGNFVGSEAVAAFGGPVPADTGHFDEDVMSVIFGTSTPQEVAMDPNITEGTRKVFTDVDVAALADIGWTTAAPSSPVQNWDYNGDGFVSQGDLDLVLLNWGDGSIPPEWVNPGLWDGIQVSQNELDAVLLNWGAGTPPSFASIPEPASGVLAGLIAMGLLRRRV